MYKVFLVSLFYLVFSSSIHSEDIYLSNELYENYDYETSLLLMQPTCPYFKLYKTDNSAVIKFTDNQPIPNNANCIRVIGIPGIERESCYVKGYAICEKNSSKHFPGGPGDNDVFTSYNYEKRSCGYIVNPINNQQQELEYCHLTVKEHIRYRSDHTR